MTQYLIKRLLAAVPTLLIVSIGIFGLVRLIPGDVVMARIAQGGSGAGGGANAALIERTRTELGLNRPFHEQYLDWLSGALQGDLGKSLSSGTPINEILLDRLPVTIEIVILAMGLSMLLAIPLGIISAVNQDGPLDYAARLFTVFGLSVPDFVIGTVTILFLTFYLDDATFGLFHSWLPPLGWYPPWEDPWTNFQALSIPVLILAYRSSAVSARMMRSTMLEVLREDYIRTARAKGVTERTVVFRHALRNSVIPVLTIMGAQISFLFGGSVIVEQIFRIPGMGQWTLDAVGQRDYTAVQAAVLMMAIVFIVVNLAVDLMYGIIDPRIRYS